MADGVNGLFGVNAKKANRVQTLSQGEIERVVNRNMAAKLALVMKQRLKNAT